MYITELKPSPHGS